MLITNTVLVFGIIHYFYRFYRFFAKFELRGWELAQWVIEHADYEYNISFWNHPLLLSISLIFSKFNLEGWELVRG